MDIKAKQAIKKGGGIHLQEADEAVDGHLVCRTVRDAAKRVALVGGAWEEAPRACGRWQTMSSRLQTLSQW
jgi:hypothetical protein